MNPERAWLFDVDGVITNPEQKIVTEPQIIDEIAKRLQDGEPVALVTGRSLDFMKERVITPLRGKVNVGGLQNFLAVGEKGGVWITYDENGQENETVDVSITVPQELQDDVRALMESEFSELMFFDSTKRTMISTEMKDGVSLEDYHKQQGKLNGRLEELVQKYGLSDDLEVDTTTIATDIQNKHVGKDFAARRVLSWVQERGINPQMFITLGDSRSDIPMAQEVHNQGKAVTLVFVGKEDDKKHVRDMKLPFRVVTSQENYEKGTLEYLSSQD
ncbi:MAG: HAD-IIB family hydrolase [Candidatus Curtissbacteria bacterium]|nr:HAD-IIB family hydrolase [Candidatus Curtissbacteria bacterium]